MHEVASSIAAIWLFVLVIVCVAMIFGVRSGTTRALLVDLITMLLVGLLIVRSGAEGAAHYVDVALVLALLSFVGTLAAVRFMGRGRLFG